MEGRQSTKATAESRCFRSTLRVLQWKADNLQKRLKTACASAVLCKYCDGRPTIHKSNHRNPDASAALCRHCDGRPTIHKSDCRPLVLQQHSASTAMEGRQSTKATEDRLFFSSTLQVLRWKADNPQKRLQKPRCFSSTLQTLRWKTDNLQKRLKTACASAALCRNCN